MGDIRSDLYFMADGQAQQMTEHYYEKEDDLQRLVADNPHLLIGKTNSESELLMLVGREFEIRDCADSSNSYFLDALFLDQSGVPVLVEVKRSSDTRIRREVIGQMMDYASRTKFWNISDIQDGFRENVPTSLLDSFDTDDYWQRVISNLKAEHVHLIFVADAIPESLKTIIEFLDRNMPSIEVYGVEIKRYKTNNISMLTSTFVGGSFPKPKPVSRGIGWDHDSFKKYLNNNGLVDSANAYDDFRRYADDLGLTIQFGRGAKYPTLSVKNSSTKLFTIEPWEYTDGLKCPVSLCVTDLLSILGNEWNEDKLRTVLTDIPSRSRGYATKLIWDTPQYLYMDLSLFANQEDMRSFTTVITTICESIQNKAE